MFVILHVGNRHAGRESSLQLQTCTPRPTTILCLAFPAVTEQLRTSRIALWAAIGGTIGYTGYQQQQAVRASLLERQQSLEQSASMRCGWKRFQGA